MIYHEMYTIIFKYGLALIICLVDDRYMYCQVKNTSFRLIYKACSCFNKAN